MVRIEKIKSGVCRQVARTLGSYTGVLDFGVCIPENGESPLLTFDLWKLILAALCYYAFRPGDSPSGNVWHYNPRYFPRAHWSERPLRRWGGRWKTGRQMLFSGITSVCNPGLGRWLLSKKVLFCPSGIEFLARSPFFLLGTSPQRWSFGIRLVLSPVCGPFAGISLSVCFNSNYKSF